MELFKDTQIDFLGIKWPFIIASLLLLGLGLGSLVVKGGPRYGIDFKGGAMVYVKFAGEPPVDRVRQVLAPKLGGTPDIQQLRDSNELIIGTELASEQELARARTTIVETLAATFGGGQPGKIDINSASRQNLVDQVRGPLAASGVSMSEEELARLADNIMNFRDTPPRSGVLRSVNDLSGVSGVTSQVMAALNQQFYAAPYAVRQTEIVGPKIGAELRQQALLATLYALGGMLIYIALRFEWVSGVAAVVAVLHDMLITVGLLSLFDFEISLTVVAALLTLVGYSMNDTVVVFDRVRENLRLMRRESLATVMNASINQTLSRTILTGGLTLLSAVCLLIFGGPVLRGFSFAFVVGILVGTYSSIFIATPIVVLAQRSLEARRQRQGAGSSAASAAAPVSKAARERR